MTLVNDVCDHCYKVASCVVIDRWTRTICRDCARAIMVAFLVDDPTTAVATMAVAVGVHDAGTTSGHGLTDDDDRFFVATAYVDQVCLKCGHPPCPHCGEWCDRMPLDEEGEPDMCCDGHCTYATPPRFWWVEEEHYEGQEEQHDHWVLSLLDRHGGALPPELMHEAPRVIRRLHEACKRLGAAADAKHGQQFADARAAYEAVARASAIIAAYGGKAGM